MQEVIRKKLTELGLIAQEDMQNINFFEEKLGVTNKYLIVEIAGEKRYICRASGKQWNGFTRYGEFCNLGVVNSIGIKTGLIYADPEGLQISKYTDEFLNTGEIDENIGSVAKIFRKLHCRRLNNNYSIADTFNSSSARISSNFKNSFLIERLFVARILLMLLFKQDALVASHNEPYLSNFRKLPQSETVCLVDWEYSGNNNRNWHLAFFALMAELTVVEEEKLLNLYWRKEVSSEKFLDFSYFKIIVTGLFMIWPLTAWKPRTEKENEMALQKAAQASEKLKVCVGGLFKHIAPAPSINFFGARSKKSDGGLYRRESLLPLPVFCTLKMF